MLRLPPLQVFGQQFYGGVGRTIPSAALSPNVTATSPEASSVLAPGAIAPLAAAVTPPAVPKLAAPPAPTPAPAPIQNASPTVPAATPAAGGPIAPVTSAAPPTTGLAADNTKPLLPQGYRPVDPDRARRFSQNKRVKEKFTANCRRN
jgi:hypothetical protein